MEEIKAIVNKDENKHPSNIEAEQALLGSILVNNDIIDEISNIVSSSIFYDPAHIKILVCLKNMFLITEKLYLQKLHLFHTINKEN